MKINSDSQMCYKEYPADPMFNEKHTDIILNIWEEVKYPQLCDLYYEQSHAELTFRMGFRIDKNGTYLFLDDDRIIINIGEHIRCYEVAKEALKKLKDQPFKSSKCLKEKLELCINALTPYWEFNRGIVGVENPKLREIILSTNKYVKETNDLMEGKKEVEG